jgi:hypothetical protein
LEIDTNKPFKGGLYGRDDGSFRHAQQGGPFACLLSEMPF